MPAIENDALTFDYSTIASRVTNVGSGHADLITGGNYSNTHVHDLHASLFVRMPVARAMGRVELLKHIRAKWNVDLVTLPLVSQIDRAARNSVKSLFTKLRTGFRFEISKVLLEMPQ